MTCCVAALCDDGKSMILIADRMIGTWAIQSELEISKLRELNQSWWMLFAGEDISSIFDIIDWTKKSIRESCEKADILDERSIPIDIVANALRQSYERKRLGQAEALYLSPIGWDIESFKIHGSERLPDFLEIKRIIADYSLNIELLTCGFSDGIGYLLSLSSGNGGIVSRYDIPGFKSIGSGATGAEYMLYYRELSYKKPLREALYYSMEAKLFGEQSAGVSEGTDVYVATADGRFIPLDEDGTVNGKLTAVWSMLRPKWIAKKSRKILNDIAELADFPLIPEPNTSKTKKDQ